MLGAACWVLRACICKLVPAWAVPLASTGTNVRTRTNQDFYPDFFLPDFFLPDFFFFLPFFFFFLLRLRSAASSFEI